MPPAGGDTLPVAAIVDVASLLGTDRIIVTGWTRLERSAPREEAGVQVEDLEIVGLQLRGASRLGAVTITERETTGRDGEIRSLQPAQDFPASSFLDLLVTAEVPASPFGALALHNESSLHLTPRKNGQEVPLDSWPPLGVTYGLLPIFGVDNDGDGLIDEDTADEDGDGLVDEDPPGAGDEDADGRVDEDPPLAQCTAAQCDADTDGLIDEDPSCIPLVNSDNSHGKAGFCVRNLSLQVAPLLPSYSVARGGPSHLHPADILALTPFVSPSSAGLSAAGASQAPFVRIGCTSLGLTADGCDDGSDGDQDDLDALSYGSDLSRGEGPPVEFSVGPGAQGLAGTGVRGQRDCPPARPGAAPEPEPDVFASLLFGNNSLTLDGNGPIGACTAGFPLGLVEAATVRDDLDALDGAEPSAVDADGDGVPERPVYFSLDASSPSLAVLGVMAGDVLKTRDGAAPSVYASVDALGLRVDDDLDALCLSESGDGVYGPGDLLYFSLAPGSPTLALIGAGPGDLLAAGARPTVVEAPGSLGLEPADDVDGLACRALPVPIVPDGDVNCNGEANSVDAALVLQFGARLTDSLPCIENGDVNEDRAIDSVDAALILQYTAGLIDRLPVPPCLLPEPELCR